MGGLCLGLLKSLFCLEQRITIGTFLLNYEELFYKKQLFLRQIKIDIE